MNMQADVTDNFTRDRETGEISPGRLAAYLRVLGALAVVGSGVVYMLQGLHSVDVNLRYWIYIALMLVLGAGGIFSFKLVQDRKGARLFFGLAVAMVPVQFSQLGGMVFNFFGGGHGNLLEVFQFSSGSLGFLLWMSGISLAVAAAVSFAAFSILCRPYAKNLMLTFALVNLAILLPVRDFPFGLILIGGLTSAILLLEKKLFSKDAVFKTFEGVAVRAVFLLPLAIAFVRYGFHQDTQLGASLLTGLVAIALANFAGYWFNTGKKRECLLFTAYIAGLFAGGGLSASFLSALSFPLNLSESMEIFVCIIPAVCWSIYLSHLSTANNGLYRSIAVVALLFMNILMLLDMTAGGLLTTCLIGAVLVIWGVRGKSRLPVTAGTIMCAISFGGLILLSVTSITVNVWLVLAIVGVVFVALSSILEKYGRGWITSGREHLIAFSNWKN